MEHQDLKFFINETLFILDEQLEAPAEKKEEPAPAPVVEEPVAPLAKKQEEEKQPLAAPAPVVEETHELVVMVFPMNQQDEELLNNLLKAIKKTRADVKLITSFSDLKPNFKTLLSFGYLNELKAKLQISLNEYETGQWENRHILTSKPLSNLHNNNVEKGKLWKALQQQFLS